ncbi:GrpB family protein [Lentzea sp. NBC_00516]|uniref:GrpB family protein n=1 Tax=Lentzea sp. NBC_00516 TaxID=2903582 RepID=UPI002E8124D9|nr:GrpB family protein [Lentzea sp. NBC_00516]WUD23308.1 GrpB family protein [Lentzea sp. NBC_00516]
MASVTDLDTVTANASDLLAAAGWSYVPKELDNRPWRRFFVKPDATNQRREAHLHLIQAGHPRWTDQIRFRDALRNDKERAQAYEDLKRRLSQQSGHDREAYTNGKAAFVAKALQGPHA